MLSIKFNPLFQIYVISYYALCIGCCVLLLLCWQHYYDFLPRLATELGTTSVIFDYSGHGDSPFDIEDIRLAQHFLEVITVFDCTKHEYLGRNIIIVGSSYGGFMALNLSRHRAFDAMLLRAPALYPVDDLTHL